MMNSERFAQEAVKTISSGVDIINAFTDYITGMGREAKEVIAERDRLAAELAALKATFPPDAAMLLWRASDYADIAVVTACTEEHRARRKADSDALQSWAAALEAAAEEG